MPIIYTYSYGFGATEKNNSSPLCCFAFSRKKPGKNIILKKREQFKNGTIPNFYTSSSGWLTTKIIFKTKTWIIIASKFTLDFFGKK